MKITKQQLKQIIKEEISKTLSEGAFVKHLDRQRAGLQKSMDAAEADEAWVLRKSGASDTSSFLHPTPASDQKKGNHKWGAKEGARTFKGENGKARAADEQKKLKKNGITVSVEKK